MENKKEVIGTTEAARLLGMSRATFYTFAKKKGIEAVSEHNPNLERPARLLYRRADIEPYIAKAQAAS